VFNTLSGGKGLLEIVFDWWVDEVLELKMYVAFYFPVGVPTKSLHTSGPTEEGSHVYLHTVDTARCFVWIWIRSTAIPQDGVPCSYFAPNAD